MAMDLNHSITQVHMNHDWEICELVEPEYFLATCDRQIGVYILGQPVTARWIRSTLIMIGKFVI